MVHAHPGSCRILLVVWVSSRQQNASDCRLCAALTVASHVPQMRSYNLMGGPPPPPPMECRRLNLAASTGGIYEFPACGSVSRWRHGGRGFKGGHRPDRHDESEDLCQWILVDSEPRCSRLCQYQLHSHHWKWEQDCRVSQPFWKVCWRRILQHRSGANFQ